MLPDLAPYCDKNGTTVALAGPGPMASYGQRLSAKRFSFLLGVLAFGLAGAAGAQSLCPTGAGECIVAGNPTITAATPVYDLGTRDLRVKQGVVITLASSSLSIRANNIVFEPAAKIVTPTVPDTGPTITLTAAGA